MPEKWDDPSLLWLEERRVAVFDPASGRAAWFQLIFADTEGPWDEEAIHAGSPEAQWHPFEYEAESDTPWDDEDDEAQMVTCHDSWTVMRLRNWRPNCLIAEPPFDDDLDQDGLQETACRNCSTRACCFAASACSLRPFAAGVTSRTRSGALSTRSAGSMLLGDLAG